MSGSWQQTGSASIAALSALILMAAAAAGGALVLRAVFSSTDRSSGREQLRQELHREGERIVSLLASDPTPDADSPLDPVWGRLTRLDAPGVTAALEDVSSRLNANWVRKDLFQKTTLGELLQPGKSPQELQQRREDRGISIDIRAEYGDLIKENALGRYFSGYGYANLNTTDEFALRKLYSIRMADDAGAEVFRTRWQQEVIRKKTLKRSDLRELLGLDYEKLFPVMNVEPAFNVHFVEPLLLSQLLSIPELKIPKPALSAQLILDARDRSELTLDELRRMTGAAADNGIYQYFGVTTWFWKITVVKGRCRLELIAARIPSDDDSPARFVITEERYLP